MSMLTDHIAASIFVLDGAQWLDSSLLKYIDLCNDSLSGCLCGVINEDRHCWGWAGTRRRSDSPEPIL